MNIVIDNILDPNRVFWVMKASEPFLARKSSIAKLSDTKREKGDSL